MPRPGRGARRPAALTGAADRTRRTTEMAAGGQWWIGCRAAPAAPVALHTGVAPPSLRMANGPGSPILSGGLPCRAISDPPHRVGSWACAVALPLAAWHNALPVAADPASAASRRQVCAVAGHRRCFDSQACPGHGQKRLRGFAHAALDDPRRAGRLPPSTMRRPWHWTLRSLHRQAYIKMSRQARRWLRCWRQVSPPPATPRPWRS